MVPKWFDKMDTSSGRKGSTTWLPASHPSVQSSKLLCPCNQSLSSPFLTPSLPCVIVFLFRDKDRDHFSTDHLSISWQDRLLVHLGPAWFPMLFGKQGPANIIVSITPWFLIFSFLKWFCLSISLSLYLPCLECFCLVFLAVYHFWNDFGCWTVLTYSLDVYIGLFQANAACWSDFPQ